MAQTTSDAYGFVVGANDAFNAPAGGNQVITLNGRGDQRVAQSLPPKAELARMGVGWDVAIATGSAFTYVAAWPTTRAELVLFNNESAGGKSYIIDSVWLYNVTSMGAAQPITIIAQNVPVVATKPTDDTAQLISSMSGKPSYTGAARRAVANTAAGQTTNLWRVLATSLVPSPTTNLGAAVYAEVFGKYIVPPQGVFAVNAVAGTAVGTAIMGISWYEVQLTLG